MRYANYKSGRPYTGLVNGYDLTAKSYVPHNDKFKLKYWSRNINIGSKIEQKRSDIWAGV